MTRLACIVSRPAPLSADVSVAILSLATVVGPLTLGATSPWSRLALEAAMAAAVSLWAVSGTKGGRAFALPLVITGVLVLQLVPLPDSMLMTLSPVAVGRWKACQEGLQAGWATVSLDPGATAAAIRRLLLGLATITAVSSLARSPTHRRWFYTALAVSAALIWAAGFVFPVDPKNRDVMGVFSLEGPIHFWLSPDRSPLQTAGCGYLEWVTVGDRRYLSDNAIRGDGFGSYIYSNHFANALCLTLPALWAMWMMLAGRRRLPDAVRLGVLAAAMGLACWTTGILAHSRAGTASLAFAAIVYLALGAPFRWLRWPAAAVATTVTLALVGFVATCQGPLPGVLEFLPEAVQARLLSLLVDTRVFAAKVAGRMFLAAPLLGAGLGTFGDFYPALVPGVSIMFFAHNEYAQWLGESGLVGAGVLAGAALMLGWRFFRFCRERPAAEQQIDAAAWAALAGVAAHAVFDWGMHAPANAFLACIVAGLAISSVAADEPRSAAPLPPLLGRGVVIALAAACLAVMPLLAREAFTAHTLDVLRRATTAARVAANKPNAPPAAPLLRDAIRAGSGAWRFDQHNWHLAALLAQANLQLAHSTDDDQERRTAEQAIETWARRARRSSAVTRGLPEPLPPAPT